MPDPIDYAPVIAQMERQRDDLTRAIEALRAVAGLGPATGGTPNGGGSGEGAGGPASRAEVPRELRSDTFFAMKAPEAIRTYLRIVKRPQTIPEIVEALKTGGFMTQAKDLYNNLYTTLLRMSERGDVAKVGENTWGLAEWYSGRVKPRSAPDTKKEGAREPDAVTTDSETAA